MTNKYLYTRIGVTEPWYFGYNEKKIRDFIQGEVKSAQQLMPTYAFLADNTHSFSLEKDPNNWLKDLNNDFDNTDMNGVNARIFTGDQTDTISIITVGKPNDRYVDGAPKKTYEISGGDGTVLATSIHLRNVDDAPLKKGKHSELINIYKNGIIAFLKEPAATTVTLPTTVKAAATALSLVAMAPNTRKLTVFIQGRVSPFLTDPSGKSSGINPLTRTLENRIPNTTVTSNLAMASVSIDNPQDGAYILTLFGSEVEDYGLSLSWIGPEQTTETRVIGFNSTGTKDVAFVVDSTKPEIVTIGSTPQPPTGLLADAVGTSSLLTRLSWQATGEAGVTKYHIYSRYDDEPYLTKIGEAVGTSFDTNHPWSGDTAVRLRIYAVSAVKGDGSESFLSNFAENNDRDHDGLTDAEEATLGTDPTKVDTDGDGFSDFVEVMRGSNPLDKLSVPTTWLTVALSGFGGGGVNSDPAGIACTYAPTGGTCVSDFPMNSTVKLFTTLDKDSLFGAWSGACSGSTICSPVMSEPRDVTATFDFVTPVKVGDTPYDTLTAAYGDRAAGTILAREYTLIGDFTLDTAKAVTLKGGYDASYTTRPGATTINGKLTIGKGSLTADRVVIR